MLLRWLRGDRLTFVLCCCCVTHCHTDVGYTRNVETRTGKTARTTHTHTRARTHESAHMQTCAFTHVRTNTHVERLHTHTHTHTCTCTEQTHTARQTHTCDRIRTQAHTHHAQGCAHDTSSGMHIAYTTRTRNRQGKVRSGETPS